MPPAPSPALRPARRTQQERRDETQKKLLDAALECLVTLGHARTTTTEVVRAAGVSQGALFKYFPTKAALLSACVEHLFAELVADYQRALAALPQADATPEAAFDLLWEIFTGPRLTVAFELYMAARTDREVLVQMARVLFPRAAAEVPEFDAWVDLLMCAMEGIVIERYGAGDVTGPALAALKRLMSAVLTTGTSRASTTGGKLPWTT